MYYSTESQIHINPARRENLSFISDRNLRKGQGTAPPPWPPQLCCYYSFESREHCPTHFPQLYEVAADHFSRGQTGQSKSRKVLHNYSTSEIYLWIFCSPTTARKLASGFLFVKQKLAVSAA